jgi:hypothetical protein
VATGAVLSLTACLWHSSPKAAMSGLAQFSLHVLDVRRIIIIAAARHFSFAALRSD